MSEKDGEEEASLRDVFASTIGFVWPRQAPGQKALFVASFCFLALQKFLNVRVPFALQRAVDALSLPEAPSAEKASAAVAALTAYCVGRAGHKRVLQCHFNSSL